VSYAFFHVTEIPPAKLPDGVMVGREDYSQCGFNRGVFTTFTIVFAPDGTLVTQTGLVNARYVKAVASPASWWTDELFRDPHDPNSPSSSSRIFKVDDLTLELADSNVPPAHFIPTRAVRLLGLKDFLPVEGNPAAANNCVNTETTLLPVAPKVGGLLRPQ
jgi:hypothetical protein